MHARTTTEHSSPAALMICWSGLKGPRLREPLLKLNLGTATRHPCGGGHFRDGQLCEPRSRFRGRFVACRKIQVARRSSFASSREDEINPLPNHRNIQLHRGIKLLVIALLFLRPPLLNCLTKRARMFSVERLGKGFAKGRTLRVADDHTRPCHRLQQCPMHAQRQSKNASRCDLREPTHGDKLILLEGVSSPARLAEAELASSGRFKAETRSRSGFPRQD